MATKRSWFRLSGSMVICLFWLLAGCDNQQKKGMMVDRLPEVSVVTIQAESLPLTTELPGRLTAVRTAQVRARVAGVLLQQVAMGGNEVKAGDVLFRIDPAPLLANYHSAQANLAKAVAAQAQARATVNRYKPLVKFNAISKLDYSNAMGVAQQADAEVAVAKAGVATARLNLDYATVKAPIAGRLGMPQVTEGALVGQNEATLLATIQQMDPIYLDLTQSSSELLKLRSAFAAGRLQSIQPGSAKVNLLLDDGTAYPLAGKLLFSDMTVDPSTGMMTLRAEFPNPEHLLLPGMYARAKLEQAMDKHALLLPQRGLLRSQDSTAKVMVVGADNKVEERSITVDTAIGDKWLVTSGLQAGERVIVEGLQKIKPGIAVKAVPFVETATSIHQQSASQKS